MNDKYPFQMRPLPYNYISLMPFCDADTMYLHHDRLYGRAVYQLNRLAEQYHLCDMSLEELILRDFNLPIVHKNQIKNAAGSIYNHQLYFDGISDAAALPPLNNLTQQIDATYGSMQDFKRLLIEAAESIPGAGWVWLVTEGNQDLHIVTTQDNETVKLDAVHPIFTIDLWEHAYFLLHQFDQISYINDWFSLLDWDRAEQRYLSAHSAPRQRL